MDRRSQKQLPLHTGSLQVTHGASVLLQLLEIRFFNKTSGAEGRAHIAMFSEVETGGLYLTIGATGVVSLQNRIGRGTAMPLDIQVANTFHQDGAWGGFGTCAWGLISAGTNLPCILCVFGRKKATSSTGVTGKQDSVFSSKPQPDPGHLPATLTSPYSP